jgi:hypothetical protein
VSGRLGVHENVIYWAMMLAKDIGTCEALLRGEPVGPARLHLDWLELAREVQLVRLDTFAIDLLHRRAELRSLLKGAA